MASYMINILRKIFYLTLGTNIFGIIIRMSFIILCVFLIIPKLYPNFQSLRVRFEFFILIAILIEILIAKLKMPDNIGVADKPDANNSSKNRLLFSHLNRVSNKKPCYLFLHGSQIRLEALLANYDYKLLGMEDMQDNQLRVFENYSNNIISCELEYFRKIIEEHSFSLLRTKLIKYLAKNRYSSVSIIINVEELTKITARQSNIISNLYACTQFLNKRLGRKTNINFIIETLAKIQGFYELIALTNTERSNSFGFSFLTEVNDIKIVSQKFNSGFKQFLTQIENKLACAHDHDPIKHQQAYIFTQQLKYFQEPLGKLVECLTIFKKYHLFKKWQQSLVTINFINTKEESKNSVISPTMEEFKNYIEAKH
jgi:hypothetical protein